MISRAGFAQPSNDDCSTPEILDDVRNYCSNNNEFTTIGAANGDVWFQFTAIAYDINITVTGNETGSNGSAGTLIAPTLDLLSSCSSIMVSNVTSANNVTTLYKGGLTIGTNYFIRIGASNTGTFKLCANNYNPIIQPGQDCATASLLCSKDPFTQTNVTGAGVNNNEAIGTCLAKYGDLESNSAWYKWIAANNGTLTFVITPTANDDIDWVLYDLGTIDNCNQLNGANAIRCNGARGIDCIGPGQKKFTKTGLDTASIDLNENAFCSEGQDGFVRFINMQQGHIYALLVNNFDSGNNGFSIEFGGTGEFLGPQASIGFTENQSCTSNQSYTFNSLSTIYQTLKWTFGDGASQANANTSGPFTITYAYPGIKTVVLEAVGEKGCSVIDIQTFSVGLEPPPPSIISNQSRFCLGDTIVLQTPEQSIATYKWEGPNGFNSAQRIIRIPVVGIEGPQNYYLSITINGCQSDPAQIIIPEIRPMPLASFETEPTLPAKLALPVTIRFINTSQNADNFLWDFGDNSTSTEANPQHEYLTKGEYEVSLTAFNNLICSNSVTKGTFFIRTDNSIFIPSTITPNGDLINDVFVVTIFNLKEYGIQIYNRWGKQLYISNDIFQSWDGTYQGQPLPVGTYYYLINAREINGNTIRKSGSVTILR